MSVNFASWNPEKAILTRQNVIDIVDLLYRYESDIMVHGQMSDDIKGKKRSSYLGLHQYSAFEDMHHIYLAWDVIRKVYQSKRACGGNVFVPDLRVCAAMTLSHEIQHSNQHHVHETKHDSFWKIHGRYRTRPSEMEARSYADNNVDVIAGVLGVSLPGKRKRLKNVDMSPELVEVAKSLMNGGKISVRDIVDELRLSKMNNALNVEKVTDILESKGIVVYYSAVR